MLLLIGRWQIELDASSSKWLREAGDLWDKLAPFQAAASLPGYSTFTWQAGPELPGDSGGRLLYSVDKASQPLQVLENAAGSYTLRFQNSAEGDACLYSFSREHTHLSLSCLGRGASWQASSLFRQLGLMFAFSVLRYGGLVLHGAVMIWRGKAIVICAPSGTGKSTHAHLWLALEGVSILNGDLALCGQENGGWTVYGQPWCGSSGECLNGSAPLGAIVLLEQGDNARVSRLQPFEGALGLLPRVFAPVWDSGLMDLALGHLDSLAATLPIFRLSCRADAEAVRVLREALAEVIV